MGALSIIVLIIVDNILLINLDCYEIKNWNDICWVVFELSIQRSVELENVVAVDVQGVLLRFRDLLKQSDVVRLLIEISILLHIQVLIFVVDNGVSGQEFFEFGLKVIGVDVGSPEDLSVAAHLVAVSDHVTIQVGA